MIDAQAFLASRGLSVEDSDLFASAEAGSEVKGGSSVGDLDNARLPGGADSDSAHAHAQRQAGQRKRPEDAQQAQDEAACQEAALRLLDAAAKSSTSLAERLARKGYEQDTIDRVVSRLTRLGLVNDELYARDVLAACLARRMGARGALADLTRKGVEPPLARRVVDEAEERGDFAQAADELGRRVARQSAGLDRQGRLRRLWAAGGRKGHSPDDIRRVAHELEAAGLL